MNDLQLVMDQLLDHNEVLHNHADVLIDHGARLEALESVINAPAPEPAVVASVDAQVEEPKDGGEEAKSETTPETKTETATEEKSESAED